MEHLDTCTYLLLTSAIVGETTLPQSVSDLHNFINTFSRTLESSIRLLFFPLSEQRTRLKGGGGGIPDLRYGAWLTCISGLPIKDEDYT